MSDDEFNIKMYDCLNEFESNIICDLVYEGVVMSDEDMKEYSGVVRECSFEDYIKSLKEFCELCVDDEG